MDLYVAPGPRCLAPAPSKLHHKLMVIDEQLIIGGSFNYTGPANYLNDENILIIGDLDSTDQELIDKQRGLARYALAEIDRIIERFGARLAGGRVIVPPE